MSDRVYRDIHSHAGATVNAGSFPKHTFAFDIQPTDGETITITRISGDSTTLTFKSTSDTAADHRRLHNGIRNTDVLIGNTLSDTYLNISTAINTQVGLIQTGSSNTITCTVSGNINTAHGVTVYENEKLLGNIGITRSGTFTLAGAIDTAGVTMTGLYSTGKIYNGIQGSGSVTVLIRDPDKDGYNVGPPANQMTTATITLASGVILPIQTFGCSGTVKVYN